MGMKQRWRAGEDEKVMRREVRDVETMLSRFRSEEEDSREVIALTAPAAVAITSLESYLA